MAKSRRKAGGATAGRYKPKKMGKGYAAYRPKMGFRPPQPNTADSNPGEHDTGDGKQTKSKQ